MRALSNLGIRAFLAILAGLLISNIALFQWGFLRALPANLTPILGIGFFSKLVFVMFLTAGASYAISRVILMYAIAGLRALYATQKRSKLRLIKASRVKIIGFKRVLSRNLEAISLAFSILIFSFLMLGLHEALGFISSLLVWFLFSRFLILMVYFRVSGFDAFLASLELKWWAIDLLRNASPHRILTAIIASLTLVTNVAALLFGLSLLHSRMSIDETVLVNREVITGGVIGLTDIGILMFTADKSESCPSGNCFLIVSSGGVISLRRQE